MREILFRGKRVDNGEWVCGDLTGSNTIHAQPPIIDGEGSYEWWGYEVNPETIGQFTGLSDKNGNRIFEGDVLINPKGEDGVVVWTTERCRFELHGENKKGHEVWISLDNGFLKNKEITGNIHDL